MHSKLPSNAVLLYSDINRIVYFCLETFQSGKRSHNLEIYRVPIGIMLKQAQSSMSELIDLQVLPNKEGAGHEMQEEPKGIAFSDALEAYYINGQLAYIIGKMSG